MRQYTIVVDENPPSDKIQLIRQHLIAYNTSHSRIEEGREVALFLEDAAGQLHGGVVAWIWGACMEIEYAAVDASLRGAGWGRKLFQRVDAVAAAWGCRTIVLDTYTFQAPEFYQKIGFHRLAAVAGYPGGIMKIYMIKHLY